MCGICKIKKGVCVCVWVYIYIKFMTWVKVSVYTEGAVEYGVIKV